MKKWNIKVEMDLRCCKCLNSRYYSGIEAETFEKAEKIAFHRFIQDAVIPRTITKEFITEPYWMDMSPKEYKLYLQKEKTKNLNKKRAKKFAEEEL